MKPRTTKIMKYRNGLKVNGVFYHGFQYKPIMTDSTTLKIISGTNIVQVVKYPEIEYNDYVYCASWDKDNKLTQEKYDRFYSEIAVSEMRIANMKT